MGNGKLSVSLLAAAVVARRSGLNLPYTIDFSTKADGAMPSPWRGGTWAISSGVAVNTPTLGAELLTDPGLEAAYADGVCGSLTKLSTPTVAESADAHGGSKAQEYTGGAGTHGVNQLEQSTAHLWYLYSAWGKRTAGAADNAYMQLYHAAGIPATNQFVRILSAAYEQRKVNNIPITVDWLICYPAYSAAASDTVIVDDHSLKVITAASLYALLPASRADVIVKAQVDTTIDDTLSGLVVRANAQINPSSSIEVLCRERYNIPTHTAIAVVKKVAGVYSSVLAVTNVATVAGAWLEVRVSGTTVQVYYNATQVGVDLAVADAGIVANKYHGLISGGGNSLKSFLLQAN